MGSQVTPTDSGETMCICGRGPMAIDGLCRDCWRGIHKPDPGEREVCGAFDLLQCMKPPHGLGPHSYRVPRTEHRVITHDLAQRILAALERHFDDDCGCNQQRLAAELRAAVERKP